MAHDLASLAEDLEDAIAEARALCPPVSDGARLEGGEAVPAVRLVKLFRAHGIALLLSEANRPGFRAGLVNAARTRRYLLDVARATGVAHPDGAASRLHGLLDALAVGDDEETRAILERSPAEFRRGHEYEDDFLYARVLRALWFDEDPVASLARWSELAGEAPDARREVCAALSARAAEDFDAAFSALLDERGARVADERQRCVLETPEVLTDRRVFVEGLALLALATRRGLPTRPEYPGCPALARRLDPAGVPRAAAPVA